MCQHVDRCFHGYRICIVTVIDHGHSLYMQQIGAPGNGLHRCNALCNLPDGKSQFFSPRMFCLCRCRFFIFLYKSRNQNVLGFFRKFIFLPNWVIFVRNNRKNRKDASGIGKSCPSTGFWISIAIKYLVCSRVKRRQVCFRSF